MIGLFPLRRVLAALLVGCVALLSSGLVEAQPLRRDAPGPPAPPVRPSEYRSLPQDPPAMSEGIERVPYDPSLFGPDPDYSGTRYDPVAQREIYGGKTKVDGPRPLIELGYPLYSEGPLPTSINLFGAKNAARPQLLVYGDWRTAVAWNDNGGAEVGQIATRLNLDVDLKLTATERFHLFLRPFDDGEAGQFTRREFFGPDRQGGDLQLDLQPETLFFEGDLGAIVAGLRDEYVSFDLPFTVGLVPLFFQNGVWFEDAILGGAFTLPALNSASLDISNYDVTFFAGLDRVTTQAVRHPGSNVQDDNGANIFGVALFADMLEGYVEAGYGYTADERGKGFDYHNLTAAFTKRYGGWLSNSVRGILNVGQRPDGGAPRTADGALLIVENSLITALPSTLVPYGNFFVGFDRPQSLARDFGAGGVLKNIGINFETDGLTGFPKLDDTANETYGGALGVSYLFNLDQQIVVEVATVQVMGGDDRPGRVARGDQYGIGVRYQLPLDMAWILRADAMLGFREADDDIMGARLEIRRKF